MIIVYRVTKKRHSKDPLSGNGGLFVGGRWHHKGVRIVYCASTFSLAQVEFFAHFGKRQKAIALVSFDIAIPESSIRWLPAEELPSDWSAVPPFSSTADLGTAWIQSNGSAVLVVPSVHSRAEYTYLINPQHPDAVHIKSVAMHPHKYDSRMWK